jgi:segregation and condensation protein A
MNVALHPYRVSLPRFDGPLDVLVELVRRGELDALDLALSDVVIGYLQTLRVATSFDLEEVGEFLVLVATLLEIKSRWLLPDAAKAAKADAPIAAVPSTKQQLVKQVSEIKRVEEAASFLAERSRERRRSLRRLADDLGSPQTEGEIAVGGAEIWDLVTVFSRLINRGVEGRTVVRDETPIAVYQSRVEAEVMRYGRLTLTKLFADDETKAQRIGRFIALLELIKLQRLWIEWDVGLDDLVVMPPKPKSAAVVASMQPLPAPLLVAAPAAESPANEAEDMISWPELPKVPEFPKRRNPWDGYVPMRRRDEPPQQFAST